MNSEKVTFSFGKNWTSFIKKYYTSERLNEAVKSMKDLSKKDTFEGKTFLDIGSGSGLFSWAAHKMNAKEITSFDVDPYSVSCTRYLWEKAGKPDKWQVKHGSILDKKWLESNINTQFDIVYSWGVLHHTGDMWTAISNAAELVKPGGDFIIAIYNKIDRKYGSDYWWKIKKFYNKCPWLGKKIMDFVYAVGYVFGPNVRCLSPSPKLFLKQIKYIRNYKTSRGMNWWTDVKDWLGGFPYEYATRDEIVGFCKELGFELKNTIPCDGTGCNQFLFSKKQ